MGLMKKLIAFILSLNLIITPIVMAQEVGENAGYDGHSQIKKGGYDFYAKQILAASTSIIGANIISQCSFGAKVPSIATYMAGSLVYIASELLGAKAQNDHHIQKLSDLKKVSEDQEVKGGEVQKEILTQSKKDQEASLDYIKKKKLWTLAVTVIYATAMGLAISEELTGHTSGVAAGAASCATTAAALSSACTVGYAGCYAGHLAACTALMPSGAVTAEAAFASPIALAKGTSTCAGVALYNAGCSSYLTSYMAIGYANCKPMPTNSALNMIMAKALVAAYAMGVTKGAEKGVNYTSMITQLLTLLVPSLEKMVMPAYNFPIPRSITFGASMALSGLVSSGLIQRQNILEKNVADVDKMLTSFNANTHDPNGIGEGNYNSPGLGNAYDPSGKKYELKALPKVAPVKTCVSNNGSSLEVSSNACRTPIKINRPKFNFAGGIKTLNDAGTLAADMANAVTSGDADRANAIAGQLGNMAAKVKEVNEKLQAEYNEKQKADKKPTLDFDKSIKDKVASMENDLSNHASSNGINMASLGPALNSDDLDKKDDSSSTGIDTVAGIPAPEIPTLDAGLSGMESDSSEDFSDSTQKVASLSESLEGFESAESDIAKDSGVSIFRQVSNRYLLNYTKIFNRKEITPVKQDEAKSP
jgi:hypothetical protein